MNEMSPLGFAVTLVIFALVFYFGFLRPGLSLAPWVPTKTRDFERVNKLSKLQSGDTFVEAGCGDARVAMYIARANPEVKVIGIEMSFFVYFVGKLRAFFSRLPNLTIQFGNALEYDYSDVDVVYTYALPETVNGKLLPKVKSELKSGSRLVSYAFVIADEDTETIEREKEFSPISVYTQP